MKINLRDLFFTYREYGLCCIPIKKMSKIPAISSWKKYQSEFPSDYDCESWGEQLVQGDIGIAVVCGLISRIIAIDLDSDEFLAQFPLSGCRKKGKRGETRFYLHSGELSEYIKPPDGRPGIEVKSDGHYTVIPPSIHPDTMMPYSWLSEELTTANLSELDPLILADFRDRWRRGHKETRCNHGEDGRAEQIARRLGKAQRNSTGWMCVCPCHDDRTPSLHISEKGDGMLLWHCFAGCSQQDVGAVLRERCSQELQNWEAAL